MKQIYRQPQIKPAYVHSNKRAGGFGPIIAMILCAVLIISAVEFSKKQLTKHDTREIMPPLATQMQNKQQNPSLSDRVSGMVNNAFTPNKTGCSVETAPAAAKGFSPQPEGFEQRAEEDSKLSMQERLARHYTE